MTSQKAITRRHALALAAAGGATAITGAFPRPALAQTGPVKIGIIAPRAGTAAFIGENGLRAAEWTAERINKSGGIGGRKVELVVEEETNAKETLERARRLVIQEKVDCIQGVYSTGVSLPIAPTLEEMRALTILWDGTTQDGLKETMPSPKYIFRSTDNECEAVMASIIVAQELKGKFKRIAAVSPDYSYGRNVWNAFKALTKKFGTEAEVVAEQWSSFTQLDFTANVAALKSAKPDLVYCVLGNADLPIFMKAAQAAGLGETTKFVLVQAGHQHGQLKKSFVPEGTLMCYNTMYFGDTSGSALHKEFVAAYRDRYKELPHWECDRAYFAMMLFKHGVEAAMKANGGKWPAALDIAANMEGAELESLCGRAAMRKDHIAEETFHQGFASHANDLDVCTLGKAYKVFNRGLQKPAGAEFWSWLETAQFSL